MDDAQLLARYAAARSEADFRALVDRHVAAVYSACLRRLGGAAADAEECAQAVFVILAREAPRLRPRGGAGLAGWLLTVARHVSLNRVRERARRSRHEREAATMRRDARTDRLWEEARGMLDELVDRLPKAQREAVQLHYLSGMTQKDAARSLGVGESTLQMRVKAGLERLRGLFRSRGVAFSAPLLAACLAERALAAAPAGLAGSACAAARGAGAAAAPVASLADGALKAMAAAKAKAAAMLGAACAAPLLAGGIFLSPALAPLPAPPFAAQPASVSAAVPPLSEWAAPAGAPAPPGDVFRVESAFSAAAPTAGAPAIAAWSPNAVKPDESFVLTGERFAGPAGGKVPRPPVVRLAARTPKGVEIRDCRVFSAEPRVLMAAVPADVPFGMYLVWVENAAGAGAPVPLNRAAPGWIGPMGNVALPGETKRVFGKNLTRDHGTKESHVYLQPAAGGTWKKLETAEVNPYAVAFKVPASQAPGAYRLWVHNGHGGVYGYGGPVDVVVQASRWVRDPGEVLLKPSGGDDAPAIQRAIDAQSEKPNGGTVRLAAGTYTVKSQIGLKEKVRLAGAGREKTTIRVDHAAPQQGALHLFGDRLALEDLTLHLAAEGKPPRYGPIKSDWPSVHRDVRLSGVRISGDPGTRDEGLELRIGVGEITGCEFHRHVNTSGGGDVWIHRNVFYGGPYKRCEGGFEANADNLVFENNHAETKDWPKGPGGSRNYLDFLTGKDLDERIWAKRVVSNGVGHGSSENGYYAFNTSRDVAVDDNKGEMYLFHGVETNWYAQVARCAGTAVTIRTDGLIDGKAVHVGAGKTFPPATRVVDEVAWGKVDGEAYVVIVGGTGLGQARLVVSHTPDTATVSAPWRIPPAADSVITLCFLYKDQVLYKNAMNAFPEGYQAGYSASNAMQFDGNAFGCAAEGNVSARTTSARRIGGTMTGPSFWNEIRDEDAKGCFSAGLLFDGWAWGKTQVIAPWLLGNAFRDCRVEVSPTAPPRGGFHAGVIQAHLPKPDGPDGEIVTACIAEGIRGKGGKHGVVVMDWSQVLLRKNRLEGYAAGAASYGPRARPVECGP